MQGIYTALLTPFDKNGNVNEKELIRLVKHNIHLGADGFYVCGSTAEALMLSVEQRKQIMKIVKDNAEDKKLIAHVGSNRRCCVGKYHIRSFCSMDHHKISF